MMGLWPSLGARHVSFKEFVVISETSGGDGDSGTSREIRHKLNCCSITHEAVYNKDI